MEKQILYDCVLKNITLTGHILNSWLNVDKNIHFLTFVHLTGFPATRQNITRDLSGLGPIVFLLSMGCVKKMFHTYCGHQLLPRFLANGHLFRVSRQSANDKDENEGKPEAVHRFPRICLKAQKTTENRS